MSGKVHQCIICTHLNINEESDQSVKKSCIYEGNVPHDFLFCYNHESEFFLKGQYRFLDTYGQKILNNITKSNYPKFIELLKKYTNY